MSSDLHQSADHSADDWDAARTQGPTGADALHLSPQILLAAYSQGIFPMSDPESGLIEWFRPLRRGVIPLDAFHVPHSLQRILRKRLFDIRMDTAFELVMRQCAAPRNDSVQTWISPDIIRAYVDLHRLGFAHSVEAWRGDRLVGGLYGVHLAGAFFGESMFSRPQDGGTDASKVCLVHLVQHMKLRAMTLLDTQFITGHLAQFGCIQIPRPEYERRLRHALESPITWLAHPSLPRTSA